MTWYFDSLKTPIASLVTLIHEAIDWELTQPSLRRNKTEKKERKKERKK